MSRAARAPSSVRDRVADAVAALERSGARRDWLRLRAELDAEAQLRADRFALALDAFRTAPDVDAALAQLRAELATIGEPSWADLGRLARRVPPVRFPGKPRSRLTHRRSVGGSPAAACRGWRGRLPWGRAVQLEARP